MEYVSYRSGLEVSRICLAAWASGTRRWTHQWVLDEENSRPVIRRALEMGINFFDTPMYSLGAAKRSWAKP